MVHQIHVAKRFLSHCNDCERDLIRVKAAMIEIEKIIGEVPLTEDTKTPLIEVKVTDP